MSVRLPFRPETHGFHFRNGFQSNFAGGFPEVRTDGLCGGMALAAFNYFRYGLPIPPQRDPDIDFSVSFEILRTGRGTSELVDYIFHSQIATFQNVSIFQFANPVGDPSFPDEFGKVRARIDRGEYLILGLKMRHGVGGLGHQVLCYGYDPAARAAIVYDPNYPDTEVRIIAAREGTNNVIELQAHSRAIDTRYRAMFEQQELFAGTISDRTTFDLPDNIARNLNFAVRPPLVNAQDGWRWCSRCEGMWYGGNAVRGSCPAGDGHVDAGSGQYMLLMNYRASSGQAQWRWCHKCQGLFYGQQRGSGGTCPGGGEHDGSRSADYTMFGGAHGNAGFAQDNWRWCHRCQSMHFGARRGTCPSGGGHDPSRSGSYAMLHR